MLEKITSYLNWENIKHMLQAYLGGHIIWPLYFNRSVYKSCQIRKYREGFYYSIIIEAGENVAGQPCMPLDIAP